MSRTPNGFIGLLAMVLLLCAATSARASVSFEQRLRDADKIRSSDPPRFAILLDELDAAGAAASPEQRQWLQYLRAYQSVVHRNQSEVGIALARDIFSNARQLDLKFRAGSMIANSYALNRNFSEGLRYLNQTLPMRGRVQDKDIRHDGITAAAMLYNQFGQYPLGLRYAREALADGPNPRARCVATLHQDESLFRLGMLPPDDASIQRHIEHCVAIGEGVWANLIRVVLARHWAARGEGKKAIELLEEHISEVDALGHHWFMSEVRSLLAEWYLRDREYATAQRYAEAAVAHGMHFPSSVSLASAYKVLYEIADRDREPTAALAFYRLHAEAEKAHVADVNAKELAYQIVREETLQKTQEIELLNRQNQVLQLQQSVDRQATQNTRLLVALLMFLVAAVGYWAYKIKRVQMTLRRFAETDALTDLSNRHHFRQQAELVLVDSAKAGEPCALIMFDLDHFKAINDGYGHVTGDWVLKKVAETCTNHCREMDLLGRLGGEEFAILLQGVDLRVATRLAEDCRTRIAQIDTRESGYTFVVTASFGVSASPLSGYALRQLLSHADQMLYSAKRGGRNRVHSYTGDTLSPPQLQVVSRNDALSARRGGELPPDSVVDNLV